MPEVTARHLITHEPVAPGAPLVSRDQQHFTLARVDEEFVYVIPKGKRTAAERYRAHHFALEIVCQP